MPDRLAPRLADSFVWRGSGTLTTTANAQTAGARTAVRRNGGAQTSYSVKNDKDFFAANIYMSID